jgi:hypothetical protein
MEKWIVDTVRCNQFGDVWQVVVMSSKGGGKDISLKADTYLASIEKIEEWLNYMPETVESMEYLLLEQFKKGWTPDKE